MSRLSLDCISESYNFYRTQQHLYEFFQNFQNTVQSAVDTPQSLRYCGMESLYEMFKNLFKAILGPAKFSDSVCKFSNLGSRKDLNAYRALNVCDANTE